ncbi:PhoU domain-containing protein [Ignicoccus hospitalis]|uniref:TrkA-C domain protein n=1 Tax=Ignicoccus hospitalis (strain KIN4/I / DSM 18386 / JCM 14125) TaxID=453591 RepID=A8AA77_IGNH4|nr:TrkA C-terminal domain-containing protein [Ignicoccus hospitalis]ABU81829.1 TrkA-C domain protein [Ignicoccus hospitalis KIN4/I]HIH90098.1 hypothetical protein [Desulfurococcaceae archaeon]
MNDLPMVVKYRPVPIKKLLRKMKDEVSIALDMAFYSLVYEDKDVAQEVEKIDVDVDNDFNLLALQLMVAARDPEDAEKLLPALRLGMSMDLATEAASDMATTVLKGYKVPKVVKAALEITEEIYVKLVVGEKLVGIKVKELKERYGLIDVIVLRRGGVMIVNPPEEVELELGDVIVIRGDREDVKKLMKDIDMELVVPEEKFTEKEKEVAFRIALLKNMTEIAFDLAVYSMLYQDPRAAEEVLEIESFMDEESAKLEMEIIKNTAESQEIYTSTVLVRSLEKMTDAATSMAQMALVENEVHPILKEVAEEGEERILVLQVVKECNMTVGQLEEMADGTALAIYLDGIWIPLPNASTELKKGMKVLLKVFNEEPEFPECIQVL